MCSSDLDDRTWDEVAAAYASIDPTAVLPIHGRLVEAELVRADAQHYRLTAMRLATMRHLAAGPPKRPMWTASSQNCARPTVAGPASSKSSTAPASQRSMFRQHQE